MTSARLIIPIDKAGRVVLPKELRDRLGLHAGAEFEVVEDAARIILQPIEKEPTLVRKGNVLVFVPEEDTGHEDIVQKDRLDRDRKFR